MKRPRICTTSQIEPEQQTWFTLLEPRYPARMLYRPFVHNLFRALQERVAARRQDDPNYSTEQAIGEMLQEMEVVK